MASLERTPMILQVLSYTGKSEPDLRKNKLYLNFTEFVFYCFKNN